MIINNSVTEETTVELPKDAQRYTFSAPAICATEIHLNGTKLEMVNDTTLPEFVSVEEKAGTITLAPATVTFLVMD